jgi:outer membrane biosynthesis protein TonB
MRMDRTEQAGVCIAIVGHMLLFGALSLSLLARSDPPKPANPPMEVAIIAETALESAAPDPVKEASPPPAPAAPKSVETAAAPPPPIAPIQPPPVRPTPPKPITPKPVPAKLPPTKPAPAKPAPAKPAPAKPAPAKPAQSAQRPGLNLSGLTDAAQREARAAAARAGTGNGGGRVGSGTPAVKTAAQIKQSIRASIYAEVRPKFQQTAPNGVDIEQLVTTLEVRVNPNGTLAAEPRFVSQTGKTDSNRPQQQLHIERAIKAVRVAAPFAMSDKDFVGIQVIELEFQVR